MKLPKIFKGAAAAIGLATATLGAGHAAHATESIQMNVQDVADALTKLRTGRGDIVVADDDSTSVLHNGVYASHMTDGSYKIETENGENLVLFPDGGFVLQSQGTTISTLGNDTLVVVRPDDKLEMVETKNPRGTLNILMPNGGRLLNAAMSGTDIGVNSSFKRLAAGKKL